MPMTSEPRTEPAVAPANLFTAAHVESILRQRGWLRQEASPEMAGWMDDAARWLGPHALAGSESGGPDERALARLLELVFLYDAPAMAQDPENQAVMTREGARDVIRELANLVLGRYQEIDSAGFAELIDGLKKSLGFSGRRLFHPLRLALAGRAGEGEMDRAILLLDRAAGLNFGVPVKGVRRRMIEFCAAFG